MFVLWYIYICRWCMCSSITKLQLMVDICVPFGIEMGVTFSLLKSNFLAIYPGKIHFPSSSIQFGGSSLHCCNKLRYLGIFITNNSKNLFDVNDQIGKFYAAIHSIISNCGVNKEIVALELLKRKYPFLCFRCNLYYYYYCYYYYYYYWCRVHTFCIC